MAVKETSLVVAENELAGKDERLENRSIQGFGFNLIVTYVFRLVLGDEMSSSIEQCKGPVTLLVNNTSELSSVIGPNCARLPCEALLTAKSHILDSDCRVTLVRQGIHKRAIPHVLSEPRWGTIESSLPE